MAESALASFKRLVATNPYYVFSDNSHSYVLLLEVITVPNLTRKIQEFWNK